MREKRGDDKVSVQSPGGYTRILHKHTRDQVVAVLLLHCDKITYSVVARRKAFDGEEGGENSGWVSFESLGSASRHG